MGISTSHIAEGARELKSWKESQGIQEQALTSPPEALVQADQEETSTFGFCSGALKGCWGGSPRKAVISSWLLSLYPSIWWWIWRLCWPAEPTLGEKSWTKKGEQVKWGRSKSEPPGTFSPTTSNSDSCRGLLLLPPPTFHTHTSHRTNDSSKPCREGDLK